MRVSSGRMHTLQRSGGRQQAVPLGHRGSRPRTQLFVTCSAPGTAEPKRTIPMPKQELVDYMRQGCRPRDQWRIGTEHEKFGFNLKDNTRLTHDQIAHVMRKLESRFGWKPIMENGEIIGTLMDDGQSVTLEPGGQFELSGAAIETLHQTCAEVNSHLYQVKAIAEELDIGFVGIGFDPKFKIDEIPMMPKNRCRLMKSYMPKVGTMGLDMMFRTCTVQVNLDFESEQDMIEKFRVGLALQPVANALFASSPFKEGKPSGYKSLRGHVWTDTDNARCGGLPFVFDDDFSFEKYADWVMNVPMYFVYRDGEYIDALGQSWMDFMDGKLPALPGEYPTISDWANHLTTVFPEVRLKRFLEMRGADGGPWRMLCALPSMWVGLLYDAQAQKEALELISDFTADEREYLRVEVPRLGLGTPFRGGTVQDLSLKTLSIARGGLERRGKDEAHFLKRIEVIAESGRSLADDYLEMYENKWGKSVDPLFRECAY